MHKAYIQKYLEKVKLILNIKLMIEINDRFKHIFFKKFYIFEIFYKQYYNFSKDNYPLILY